MSDAPLHRDGGHDPMLREAAGALLGVSTADAPGESRRELLARLEENAYLPPPGWREVIAIAFGAPADGEPLTRAKYAARWNEIETRLRSELDDFAGRFFAFPPNDRLPRWRVLSERCGSSPPCRRRLMNLEPGLARSPGGASPPQSAPAPSLPAPPERLP
jgi:hypothetical protein